MYLHTPQTLQPLLPQFMADRIYPYLPEDINTISYIVDGKPQGAPPAESAGHNSSVSFGRDGQSIKETQDYVRI
jgi:hypothetical protein